MKQIPNVGTKTTEKVAQQQQPEKTGSFRSFAEYRLRVSNQSPLAVRSKDFNANLRLH
jgi:hypothetical protein